MTSALRWVRAQSRRCRDDLAGGKGGELAEVPADQLQRGDAEPGVTAVVGHLAAAEVLGRHPAFGLGELGLGFLAGARHRADHSSLALDLDDAQLLVMLT